MVKKKQENNCSCMSGNLSCCKIEALVSVDDRGQMVLPKELREKASIHNGDKLAIISYQNEGKICCIALIKADDFSKTLKELLGPMAQEIMSGSK
jgi:antitoxin PrlF